MLAMPQSLPAADRKLSAFCRRSVNSAEDSPCAEAFCCGDRLGERIHRDHVQDRREGLGLHDRPLVAGAHDGRLDEVAALLGSLAAGEHLAAGGARLLERAVVALDRARSRSAGP